MGVDNIGLVIPTKPNE
jgi:hypothetical protein